MELLIALMDHLGIARATIVGHSIGGRLARTFAAEHAGRVDKLVLVSPDGFASPRIEYSKAPDMPASLSQMKHVLLKALLLMSLEPAYADASLLTDELVTRYHDLALAPGSRTALLERMAQARLVDPVSLLHQIRAPTLLLWGEHDAMIPFTNSADYLRALSGARLASVPGVGHLPHEEAPERSLALLWDFLKQP